MAIRDKTHHNHEMLKVANSPNTIQPNYYLSVASVDSSSIESTCIFLETLNKTKHYYPLVARVDSSLIESTCIFSETLNKTHKRMCGK